MSAAAKESDRRDDAVHGLERIGERRVRFGRLGIEERDIERDRPRMGVRQRAHDPGQTLSRHGIAPGFAESPVVDRDDDDAFRRGTRACEKEAPVERQVFDPVQSGGGAADLLDARQNSENNAGGEKNARQQQ